MELNDPKNLEEIAAETKYPLEAFQFVRQALDYTVHRVHENPEIVDEVERHVDGRQLCLGIKEYALDQYGLLARTVLSRWRIRSTEDFGAIVFAMVSGGLMQKTDEDHVSDFEAVYAFDEALDAEIPVDQVPLEDATVHELKQG